MSRKNESWAKVGEKWRWAMPDRPWLKAIDPELHAKAIKEGYDATEIIRRLWKRIRQNVMYLLRGYVAGSDLAEDATNNVFVRIAERNPLIKWNPKKKRTRKEWLNGIICMVVRETIRFARRCGGDQLEANAVDSRITDPRALVEKKELVELTQELVADLAENRRYAVQKKYSSDVEVRYPKPRSAAQEHVDRSRGLGDLRARACAEGLLL